MNKLRKQFLALAILLYAVPLLAQNHPNLTGTWKLNVAKSDMGNAAVKELVVEVDHKDPVLKYVVHGEMLGGQRFEEKETVTTDGKASRDSHGLNVEVSWDGPALLVVGTADDKSMVYLARLTVSNDGKTMARVFTQKDDPQQRHEIYDKQ